MPWMDATPVSLTSERTARTHEYRLIWATSRIFGRYAASWSPAAPSADSYIRRRGNSRKFALNSECPGRNAVHQASLGGSDRTSGAFGPSLATNTSFLSLFYPPFLSVLGNPLSARAAPAATGARGGQDALPPGVLGALEPWDIGGL